MDELSTIFAQLRLDIASASTPEQRSMRIDRAEIMTKALMLREAGRIRKEAYDDGRGIVKPSGGMVSIKRGGGAN